MLKRQFRITLFAFIALFIAIFLGSISVNVNGSIITELDLSKIYGEYDFTSTDYTTVIIEIEEKSIVEAKHMGKTQTQANLKNARKFVSNEIFEVVPKASVLREYDYLFSGFALELQEKNVLSLAKVPGIKAIYPNVEYQALAVNVNVMDEVNPNMQDSMPYVGAPSAWDLGYTGEGMTVAVIDTGVDYTHPELAHAFGDYKGYDFYDNDNDPMNSFNEEVVQYHGTHVAGTIVASSFGIAPDANLLAYRVLGPNGGSSIQVIAGVEQAVIDGADVMNLSLGNVLNEPDYATSIALDWAMEEGVVAVTSNGNEGPDNWTVGSPGASRSAISVGSIGLPSIEYDVAFATENNNSFPSLKVMGTPNPEDVVALDGNTYDFVYVGRGTVNEFASVDVEGKVALIMRGGNTFVEKSQNAKDNGAVAAIIFNNQAGEINASGNFSLPTFQLTFDDGYEMYLELESGNNQVTISANALYAPEFLSDFSSRGPAFETWMIKPDIVAPGDYILSTYPGGYYAYAGGTSMASPHVAAAALLILQAHPEYTPEDVKAVLMNSADILINPLTNKPYTYNEQGAGNLRIIDAILMDTIVNPGSFSFGKFVKNNGKQVKGGSFEIKNLSNVDKVYTFRAEFFGNPSGIQLMTSNNLKVKSNSTQNVNYNVQVDTTLLNPGFYQGRIVVSDGVNEIIVPTILFIQEPDYPRVTLAGVDQLGPTEFIPYAYVPAGAEYLEIAFYSFDSENGAIGNFLGYWDFVYNVAPGFYEFSTWDGTIQGYKLPPGEYVIIAYAEYLGKADAVAYLFEIQ